LHCKDDREGMTQWGSVVELMSGRQAKFVSHVPSLCRQTK
jgi:hypothetical protein